MSISLNEPKVAWKTSAKKVVVGATRRRKVVFSTQEKRSSGTGTRSGTVAILVIRQVNCMLKKTNSALRMGIREHEETLMGLATLCIHVFKASQA